MVDQRDETDRRGSYEVTVIMKLRVNEARIQGNCHKTGKTKISMRNMWEMDPSGFAAIPNNYSKMALNYKRKNSTFLPKVLIINLSILENCQHLNSTRPII